MLEAKLDDVMAHEPQLLGQMAYIEEKQASSSAGSCAGSKRKRVSYLVLKACMSPSLLRSAFICTIGIE